MIFLLDKKMRLIFFSVMLFGLASLNGIGTTPVFAEDGETKPGFDLADPKIIAEGRIQFAQTCVYCHGNAGSGGKAGPIAGRTDLTQDYLFTTISNGKRAGSLVMPAWKDSLDEPTIWKLVAYVASLQAKP